MDKKIDQKILSNVLHHYNKFGLKYRLKGFAYERCAEIPYIINFLQPFLKKNFNYLDIGSGGESPLPTYFLQHSCWNISCIDKFSWIKNQLEHAKAISPANNVETRFHVYEKNLLSSDLPSNSFDIITSVSVIEHFEGENDSLAMRISGKLLRPGGLYVLTTLINEGHYNEFYVKRPVYGVHHQDRPVFYQRHYDLKSFHERIISPSGLTEKERIFFGDYNFQAFEKLFGDTPKAFKIFYKWATPFFARKFLSYKDYPVCRPNMMPNTSSGIIVVLEKPL